MIIFSLDDFNHTVKLLADEGGLKNIAEGFDSYIAARNKVVGLIEDFPASYRFKKLLGL